MLQKQRPEKDHFLPGLVRENWLNSKGFLLTLEIQTDSGCTEERVLVQFNSPNMDHMQQWQQGERTQVADTFAGGFEATQWKGERETEEACGKSTATTSAECTGSSPQQEEPGPLSSHFQNIFFTTIFKGEIEANHSHPPLNSMKWSLLSRISRDSNATSLSKKQNKTKNLSAPLLHEPFQMIQATWTLGSLPCPLHQSARLLRSWRKATTTAGCLQRSVGGLGLPCGSVVRLPMQETQKTGVWSLGGEDPLEEETATHSSIFAWRIPWTEEPGGLQSKESQIVGHD